MSDFIKVKLTSSKLGVIYYTLDGTTPTSASQIYTEPIIITENTTLSYYSDDGFGHISAISTSYYDFLPDGDLLTTEDGIYITTEDGLYILLNTSTTNDVLLTTENGKILTTENGLLI